MSALGSSRNHYYLKAHLRRKRQTWAEQNHAREKKKLDILGKCLCSQWKLCTMEIKRASTSEPDRSGFES